MVAFLGQVVNVLKTLRMEKNVNVEKTVNLKRASQTKINCGNGIQI